MQTQVLRESLMSLFVLFKGELWCFSTFAPFPELFPLLADVKMTNE